MNRGRPPRADASRPRFGLTARGFPSILPPPEVSRSPTAGAIGPRRTARAVAGPTRTDTDVMRQALTKIALALGLVLASPARGDNPPADAEAPIARARRLIQAGDRPAAVTLLEDALIDGPAGDRPAALDLLRQSYEAMAREAEASGRADDAARYRDNLAILARARESSQSPPTPEAPKPPARSAPKVPAKTAPRTPGKPAPEAPRPIVKPAPAPAGRPATPTADEPTATTDEAIPEPPARVDPPPPFQPARLAGAEARADRRRPEPGRAGRLARAPQAADARAGAAGPIGVVGAGDDPRAPHRTRRSVPQPRGRERSRRPRRPALDRPSEPDRARSPRGDDQPRRRGRERPRPRSRSRGAPRPREPATPGARADDGGAGRRPDWPRPIACSWRGDGTSRAASTRRWPPATCCRRSGGRTGPIADTRPSSAGSTSGRDRVGSGTRSRARSAASSG